jgi:hypothetical protein
MPLWPIPRITHGKGRTSPIRQAPRPPIAHQATTMLEAIGHLRMVITRVGYPTAP